MEEKYNFDFDEWVQLDADAEDAPYWDAKGYENPAAVQIDSDYLSD
jgi:hypothetical protein